MKTLQLAVLTLVMSFASQAAAQYTFSCYPPTEHNIGPTAPNVMFMLDVSGSMNDSSGEDVDGDGSNDSLLKVAKLAIVDVANSVYDPGACPGNCDDVRLGMAYFASSQNGPNGWDARIRVDIGEDTAPDVITSVNAQSAPGGTGTRTDEAMALLEWTTQLRDPSRPNVAALITDGEASSAARARAAITHTCNARNRAVAPLTTYVVGFGSGSRPQMNSSIAAAGGTGQCCQGATAPCAAANEIDVCNTNLNSLVSSATSLGAGYSCTGSLEATGSDIKDQLLSVLAETSCTFALDIPVGYPNPGADPDPAATEVKMWHGIFGTAIPIPPAGDGDTLPDYLEDVLGVAEALAEDYEDEGWEFTSASRQFVRLSPKLCEDVQMNNVTKVTTEIACACEFIGEPCTVSYTGVGGQTFTNSQLERMRCGDGVYICVGSTDVCSPIGGKMPEICNGLDDDCDGQSDNMSTSWDDPDFAGLSLPAAYIGLDCNRKDVCSCPATVPLDHTPGDFSAFLAGWTPVCQCGEGLEPAKACE